MSKRKNQPADPAVGSNPIQPEMTRVNPEWEVDPENTGAPPELPEGYTWCPTCQASFEGDVCPGCSPGIGIAVVAEGGERVGQGYEGDPGAEAGAECPLHQFIKNDAGSFVCEKCGRVLGENETPPDPTTLAEVAEPASTETTTVTEILPEPLTDAEDKEIGKQQAQANQEIAQAEDELKSVKSQYKSRIDSAEARRNEYAAIINAGHQQKQVECHLIKDFRENTITLVRLDTEEIVRTRTMTAGAIDVNGRQIIIRDAARLRGVEKQAA